MNLVQLVLTTDEALTLVGVLENETYEEDFVGLKRYVNRKILEVE
jgi:hypothetical protein